VIPDHAFTRCVQGTHPTFFATTFIAFVLVA
jgi:hypothetical protein